MMNYKINVKTGNELGAGTDADVSIILVGELGKTDELVLNSDKNNFERNEVRCMNSIHVFIARVNKAVEEASDDNFLNARRDAMATAFAAPGMLTPNV